MGPKIIKVVPVKLEECVGWADTEARISPWQIFKDLDYKNPSSYFLLRYDLPSQVIKFPFKLNRSRMAVAVAASKIFPHCEGIRFVVTMVGNNSLRLEMI